MAEESIATVAPAAVVEAVPASALDAVARKFSNARPIFQAGSIDSDADSGEAALDAAVEAAETASGQAVAKTASATAAEEAAAEHGISPQRGRDAEAEAVASDADSHDESTGNSAGTTGVDRRKAGKAVDPELSSWS